jgi:Domain of unknown function (DUF6697)
MFVGLGNEKDVFTIQETHELFVQFAPKQMFYAGRYNLQKVEDLTIDEWRGLDSKVIFVIKDLYSWCIDIYVVGQA